MENLGLIIDEEPKACWDWSLSKKNIEFLDGIDPSYFKFIAELNADKLEGDDRHRSALALRISYSQALEVLFALLSALVQAPNCVVGWMLSYKNHQLKNVVKKIHGHKNIHSMRSGNKISWEQLSKHVHSCIGCDPERLQEIVDGFGKLWKGFARDFLDEKIIQEYNSAKHGLRTKVGGFNLQIGIEETQGAPAPDEKMHYIGGSKFGTSYFSCEYFNSNNKVNFQPRRNARNWDPYNFLDGLILLSISINNVISYLKILNKVDPSTCIFQTPNDKDFHSAPWKRKVGVVNINFDKIIRSKDVQPITKNEILEEYGFKKSKAS